MSFRVRLTDAALTDIRDILRWISARSPAGAETWFKRWLEIQRTLENQADTFGIAPESEGHPSRIQQVIFKTRRGLPYRALFTIRDADVFVLHIRGPGQDLLARGALD